MIMDSGSKQRAKCHDISKVEELIELVARRAALPVKLMMSELTVVMIPEGFIR